jgi:hypothetical protein
MLRITVSFLVFIGSYSVLWAQQQTDTSRFFATWSAELSGHYGRILRHTPNIRIPIENNTWGLEYAAECQLQGAKGQIWHRWANYPRVGIAASYQNFVDPRIGQGFGIMPYISMDFIRSRNDNFRLYGRLALGFSYLTKHYELPNNPDNNIVGSHFGNNTALRLAADIRLARRWRIRPSASFTHYSNAAAQLPNYGINVVSFHLGLLYSPYPVDVRSLPARPIYRGKHKNEENRPLHRQRYVFSVNTGGGIRESITYGGPKYPIFYGSLEAGKFISNIHRFRLGAEYEYIGSTAAFLQNYGTMTRSQSNWAASRLSIVAGLEFVWGRVSLGVNYGAYLTRNALQPLPRFFRITARWYPFGQPFAPNRNAAEPYLLIGLKTHRIVAEYAFFGIGCNF